MDWIEVIKIKPHMPRKRRYAVCSVFRNEIAAVHRTIGGNGIVSGLFGVQHTEKGDGKKRDRGVHRFKKRHDKGPKGVGKRFHRGARRDH